MLRSSWSSKWLQVDRIKRDGFVIDRMQRRFRSTRVWKRRWYGLVVDWFGITWYNLSVFRYVFSNLTSRCRCCFSIGFVEVHRESTTDMTDWYMIQCSIDLKRFWVYSLYIPYIMLIAYIFDIHCISLYSLWQDDVILVPANKRFPHLLLKRSEVQRQMSGVKNLKDIVPWGSFAVMIIWWSSCMMMFLSFSCQQLCPCF